MDVIEIAKTHNVEYVNPVEGEDRFAVFTYANALLMIEKIRYECFPIIAIEVYEKKGFRCNCVFTCKRKKDESMPQFTRRSCDEAIAYINNLSGDKDDYLFDISICSTFDNVPVEMSEGNNDLCEEYDTGWSQKQNLFAVLFADAIIAFCLNIGPSVGLGIFYISFVWGCISGILGLILLPFKKLRDIGFVLVVNTFLLPIIICLLL